MGELYSFRNELGMDLDELRDYSETLEELLESKIKKFNRLLENRAKKVPIEELEDFYSDHYHDHLIQGMAGYQLHDRYPNLLRKSVFTSCYSSFEVELMNYCKYIKKKNSLKLTLHDLKHEGITKAQVYLKNVAGIAFPDSKKDWSDIKIYNYIRNKIVHNNSFIPAADPKDNTLIAVRDFIEKNPDISIDQDNLVFLKREFSMGFLKTVESFLRELYGPAAFEYHPYSTNEEILDFIEKEQKLKDEEDQRNQPF